MEKAKKVVRIGMVDYSPSVGHARGFLIKLLERQQTNCLYQGEIVAYTAMDQNAGAAWAKESGVEYFDNPEGMKSGIDAVVIPASTNPETHLQILKSCVTWGLPIFVDKPFAPDAETAKEMFSLADEHNGAVSSTSALRFSKEIAALVGRNNVPNFVQTWGSDNERYDEFVIHPVEMAVALMRDRPISVCRRQVGNSYSIRLEYVNGRQADVFFNPGQQTYEAAACYDGEWVHTSLTTDFWEGFLDNVLESFALKKASVPKEQTLIVMDVLSAASKSQNGEIIYV